MNLRPQFYWYYGVMCNSCDMAEEKGLYVKEQKSDLSLKDIFARDAFDFIYCMIYKDKIITHEIMKILRKVKEKASELAIENENTVELAEKYFETTKELIQSNTDTH